MVWELLLPLMTTHPMRLVVEEHCLVEEHRSVEAVMGPRQVTVEKPAAQGFVVAELTAEAATAHLPSVEVGRWTAEMAVVVAVVALDWLQ